MVLDNNDRDTTQNPLWNHIPKRCSYTKVSIITFVSGLFIFRIPDFSTRAYPSSNQRVYPAIRSITDIACGLPIVSTERDMMERSEIAEIICELHYAGDVAAPLANVVDDQANWALVSGEIQTMWRFPAEID